MMLILKLLGIGLLINIIIFVISLTIKEIHKHYMKKEIKRIYNKSRYDEQFLDMICNIFKLDERESKK